MESRPKRVSKKSAKLLSYQEELGRHETKKLTKKYIKNEAGIIFGDRMESIIRKEVKIEPITPKEQQKELQLQLTQLTVPKLKIKIPGPSRIAGDVTIDSSSAAKKSKKEKVSRIGRPRLSVAKKCLSSHRKQGRKGKKEVDLSFISGSIKVEAVHQHPLLLPTDVEPTDVEIEAGSGMFGAGEFVSEEGSRYMESEHEESGLEEGMHEECEIGESGLDESGEHEEVMEEEVMEEQVVKEEVVDQEVTHEEKRNLAGKRQRKLPVKLESDDFEVDPDLLSNKAAKFFETKKAEQKAASAIDKSKRVVKKSTRNRMPNAYNMWSNSHRLKLKAQSADITFAMMNKKLGEAWHTLPIKEKNMWARRAKRLATHGAPKNNESLKFLGSKAIASLQRNNLPVSSSTKGSKATDAEAVGKFTDLNPVYKVTQTEPVDLAAHFEIMSETFNTIGTGLAKKGDVTVQGSLTMLLDSLLCSVSSLLCLVQQVPELDGNVDPETHRQRMANIAYYIPDI